MNKDYSQLIEEEIKKEQPTQEELNKRHKFGFHAFIILLILETVNMLIKSLYGTWAEPYAEYSLMLCIPALYFISQCIFNNAVDRRYYAPISKIGLWSITLLILFFDIGELLSITVFSDHLQLISNGIVTDEVLNIIWAIYSTYLCVIFWIKRRTILEKV